jgi:hypothetical protein
MTDPQRFSQTHSDLFGLFKAELARAGTITGLPDASASLWPRFTAFYQNLARLPRNARRALQRRWRRSLAGIALLHALGQVPALAGQIDVGVGGCTLVDAITAANTDQQTGSCTAGSGADTISLPPGSIQTLTSENNYSGGYNGVPVITSAIVIQGNGSTIRRASSAPQFRIVAVDSNGDLTLRDTTLSGGAAAGDGARPGGGVFNEGALTLINSTVSGNSAGTYGGGLSNTGTLTLTNSTVAGNFADSFGGGVLSVGPLALTNSTISGNSARYGGGAGIGGAATLANSTVSGNFAAFFGGGVLSYGALALTNSTVSGNSAAFDGGGVRNFGTLTLTNSTVSGNSAVDGGGLFTSSTLALDQSLVSGNSASSQGPEVFNASDDGGTPGIIISNGFNLFGHDGLAGFDGVVSGAPGASDLVPAIPLSAILDPAPAANGGPTRTHALVSGSPAIDAIPVASCASAVSHGPRMVTRTRSPTATSVPSSVSRRHPCHRPRRYPRRQPPIRIRGCDASGSLVASPSSATGSGRDRAVQYPRRCLHPCQCLEACGGWRGEGAAAHQVRRRRRQHPPGWDHEPPAHPHETRPADRQDEPPEQAPRRDGDPERHRTCPDSAGHDQAQAITRGQPSPLAAERPSANLDGDPG